MKRHRIIDSDDEDTENGAASGRPVLGRQSIKSAAVDAVASDRFTAEGNRMGYSGGVRTQSSTSSDVVDLTDDGDCEVAAPSVQPTTRLHLGAKTSVEQIDVEYHGLAGAIHKPTSKPKRTLSASGTRKNVTSLVGSSTLVNNAPADLNTSVIDLQRPAPRRAPAPGAERGRPAAAAVPARPRAPATQAASLNVVDDLDVVDDFDDDDEDDSPAVASGGPAAAAAALAGGASTDGSWIEQHAPTKIEELALHAKKLTELQDWIHAAVQGCREGVHDTASSSASAASVAWASIVSGVDLSSRPSGAGAAATGSSSGLAAPPADDLDWDAIDFDALDAQVEAAEAEFAWKASSQSAREPRLPPVQPMRHPKLLILMGPPGIGKSTAISLICASKGIQVREWIDPAARGAGGGAGGGVTTAWHRSKPADGAAHAQNGSDAQDEDVGGVVRGMYNRSTFDGLSYELSGPKAATASGGGGVSSSLDDFSRFLGHSRLFKCLALEDGAEGNHVVSRNDGGGPTSARPSQSASAEQQLMMIEDLPRPHGFSEERQWRSELQSVLLSFLNSPSARAPAVIIASEGDEPGDPVTKPALIRMLGRDVVEHAVTTVLEVPRTPDGRLRKVLQSLAAVRRLPPVWPAGAPSFANGAGDGGAAVAGTSQGTRTSDIIETVVASARGDLRHAIMTLQFACTAAAASGRAQHVLADGRPSGKGKRGSKAKAAPTAALYKPSKVRDVDGDAGAGGGAASMSGMASRLCGRDDFFDQLHSLGKLLYAKRIPATGKLESDPDSVMACCAYDAATVNTFLSENCIGFHSDVTELSRTLDVLSAADVLLGHGSKFGGSGYGSSAKSRGTTAAAYPEQYTAALASRAVAAHNVHPTPSTFRPIRKPALYAVMRVRDANRRWIEEEGLGLGFDVGIGAINDQYQDFGLSSHAAGASAAVISSCCLTDGSERALHAIPAIGLMLTTLRKRCGPIASPVLPSAPRLDPATGLQTAASVSNSSLSLLSLFTKRSEALFAAACAYGKSVRFGKSGEMVTSIGDGVRSSTQNAQSTAAAGSGAGASTGSGSTSASSTGGGQMSATIIAATDDDVEDEGIGRQVSEETDVDVNANQDATPAGSDSSSADSADVSGLVLGTAKVSTAGLAVGMWEASAALRGVDVWRKEPSAYQQARKSAATRQHQQASHGAPSYPAAAHAGVVTTGASRAGPGPAHAGAFPHRHQQHPPQVQPQVDDAADEIEDFSD